MAAMDARHPALIDDLDRSLESLILVGSAFGWAAALLR
jgi:hypothetical protein